MQERQAYYFCDEDEIMNSNLKFGTYQKAEENCNKIMIPDLCQNQTQRSLLKTFSIGKYGRYWTGIKRFNSTHFKGNSILSKNDLACVGSESHPVNYLRDYTRLGLSITPFTDFLLFVMLQLKAL